jgi:hypothetical protein
MGEPLQAGFSYGARRRSGPSRGASEFRPGPGLSAGGKLRARQSDGRLRAAGPATVPLAPLSPQDFGGRVEDRKPVRPV